MNLITMLEVQDAIDRMRSHPKAAAQAPLIDAVEEAIDFGSATADYESCEAIIEGAIRKCIATGALPIHARLGPAELDRRIAGLVAYITSA